MAYIKRATEKNIARVSKIFLILLLSRRKIFSKTRSGAVFTKIFPTGTD